MDKLIFSRAKQTLPENLLFRVRALNYSMNDPKRRHVVLQKPNEEMQKIQELEFTRDKYYDLFRHAPMGYLTLDSEGKILEANLAAAELLERPTIVLKGKTFSDFVTPRCVEMYHFHYRSAYLTGIRRNCELELIRKNNLHVQLHTLAMTTPRGYRTSLCDIPAVRSLQRQ